MLFLIPKLTPSALLTQGKPAKRFRAFFIALMRMRIIIIDEVVNFGYKERRLKNQTLAASNI